MAVPDNATLPHVTPKQLLCTSQSGGPNAKAAQDRVVDVFGDKLKELTARTCRRYYLQDQEQEDVLAETYQQLFNPEIARFAVRRGKPEHYFKGLVQNAARKIMAQLGARRRQGASPGGQSEQGQQDVVAEGDNTFVKRYRTPPAPPSPAEDAEIRDTVKYILEQAPPRVLRTLELSYWEDWSLQRIAAHLGVSRFALAREVRGFFKKMNSQFGDG
ncbi:MAG: sigma-70 family RNA polymerase sigma factor [Planctomycetes bacterium]|nr:sigma-70 family RNA polymerase sigma factor [Planctomycetota bacterium]